MTCRAALTAVVLAAALMPLTASGLARARGAVSVAGIVTASTDTTLEVRGDDGSTRSIRLGRRWSLVTGRAVGRHDLARGDVIGLTAIIFRSPGINGLIGRRFLTVDPSIPLPERLRLMRRFLPPAHAGNARTGEPGTRLVVGLFSELRPGGVMVIRERSVEVTVKLGPEASGYRLFAATKAVPSRGDSVVIQIVEGRGDDVLILSDNPIP